VVQRRLAHPAAVAQALTVAFLWSTSWILVKLGLDDVPVLVLVGLRYAAAFACLLPVMLLRSGVRTATRTLGPAAWARLGLLGLLLYGLNPAGLYLALAHLPAATVSLVNGFAPAVVAVLGSPLLGERPTGLQWAGTLAYLAGALIYLAPVEAQAGQGLGLAAAGAGMLAYAAAELLGRWVNRHGLPALAVTTTSMGVGGGVTLAIALLTQPTPQLAPSGWLLVGWLAVVNTAVAYTVWNHTKRWLSAMQSTLINNTMLVHVAVLGWAVLGERLSPTDVAGLLLAVGGVVMVQLRHNEQTSGMQVSGDDEPRPFTIASRGPTTAGPCFKGRRS
jgi:drug/metabolite transporter (DMT)-like permease